MLLLLSILSVNAQHIQYADSVYHELVKSPKDTFLIRELNNTANRFVFNQPDTALFYINNAFKFSESADYEFGIVSSVNMLGYAYEMKEMFDTARVLYQKAAVLAEQHKFDFMLINIYNNLSILESTVGNYESSLESALKALDFAEKLKDSVRLGTITGNIGLRYSELQYQEMALDYFKKAVKINSELKQESKLVSNFGNMGRSYYILNQLDSAELYYRKAILMTRENDLYRYITHTLGLAVVFVGKEQYDSAMVYQKYGYEAAIKSNDKYSIAQALLISGNVFTQKKEYKKAEKDILESIKIAKDLKIKPLLIDGYDFASEFYKITGDYKNALEYSALFNTLQDTLYRQEKDKAFNKIKDFEDEKSAQEKLLLSREIELEKIKAERQRIQRNIGIAAGVLLLLVILAIFNRLRYIRRTKNQLAKQNKIINEEKERSEGLLLNILPHETAQELKTKGSAQSRHYDSVTVLFTDFVGFTQIAEHLSPSELVSKINFYFSEFDRIISKHHLEKIKTIGDAYMCAGGLPVPNETHAMDAVSAALEIRDFIERQAQINKDKNLPYFQVRIGIHTGPVVAGIVGIKKFAYDIWGDTVNTASRLESSGEPGMINISQTTFERVHHLIRCIHRGKINAKGKGEIDMYFIDTETN